MSMILDNRPTQLAGRILDNLVDAAGRMVYRIRRRIEINRNRRILHALPDEILRDIGISRGDINYATDDRNPGRDARWRLVEQSSASLRGRGL